jgi:hypothetical protein
LFDAARTLGVMRMAVGESNCAAAARPCRGTSARTRPQCTRPKRLKQTETDTARRTRNTISHPGAARAAWNSHAGGDTVVVLVHPLPQLVGICSCARRRGLVAQHGKQRSLMVTHSRQLRTLNTVCMSSRAQQNVSQSAQPCSPTLARRSRHACQWRGTGLRGCHLPD